MIESIIPMTALIDLADGLTKLQINWLIINAYHRNQVQNKAIFDTKEFITISVQRDSMNDLNNTKLAQMRTEYDLIIRKKWDWSK